MTDASSTPTDWERCPALWDEESYQHYLITYWRGGWEAPMNWYKAFFLNFEDEKHFIKNPRIESPFLTIIAEDDPAVPVEAAETSKHLLPNGELLTIPGGHWVGQEKGPELARIVTKWLHDLEEPSKKFNRV
jgi:pimeloyl-ACP methyl ester carboxylesterase